MKLDMVLFNGKIMLCSLKTATTDRAAFFKQRAYKLPGDLLRKQIFLFIALEKRLRFYIHSNMLGDPMPPSKVFALGIRAIEWFCQRTNHVSYIYT
jgi:hypothetical protein